MVTMKTFSYTGLTQQEADVIGKLVGQQPASVLFQHGAPGLFGKLHEQFSAQMATSDAPAAAE